MRKITEAAVRALLATIPDPSGNATLSECVDAIVLDGNKVIFAINIDQAHLEKFKALADQAANKIKHELEQEPVITLTANYSSTKATSTRNEVKGIDKIIMVASGKGGVGKSTIAFNLALSLRLLGYKVGIIDADIYGPSLPSLSGISHKPVLQNNLMIPHKKFDISLMSVGYLVDEAQALIWRGPMVTKMLYQLIRLTDWQHNNNNLDYLIIDTPPGTGDVHLSLAENYKIDGAIVVSTPQDLASNDAIKALAMFNKMDINILGIVENMSYLQDKNNQKIYLFGKSNLKKLASRYQTKIIGTLPFDTDLVMASDHGKPLPYYKPKHYISQRFIELSKTLLNTTNL